MWRNSSNSRLYKANKSVLSQQTTVEQTFLIAMVIFRLLQLTLAVAGFALDKHVEVGGLFDLSLRNSPEEAHHIDDSFFNTDSLSMYNSVLNHVSTTKIDRFE